MQFKGIQVSGTGKIGLVPNVAYIHGGVITEGTKVHKAVKDNSERMLHAFALLKKIGVPDKSIATTTLQINPRWSAPTKTKKATITGYVAQNAVTVKLKDMELVGETLEALSSSVNDISLKFAAEYPDKEAEALGMALHDAKTRASKIAQASGITLGPLYSCIESRSHNQPMRLQAYSAVGGGMPLAEGDIDLTVTVEVVYSIPGAEGLNGSQESS